MTDVYVSWTDRQSQPGVCRRRRGHWGQAEKESPLTTSPVPRRQAVALIACARSSLGACSWGDMTQHTSSSWTLA